MGLWYILQNTVAANINVSIENTVLIILLCGSIIFMAKDFKLGIIMLFLFSGGVFMLFYNYGLNYAPFIAVFFMSLVIMAFTLFFAAKTTQEGGAFI